jgi:hypothetical protein
MYLCNRLYHCFRGSRLVSNFPSVVAVLVQSPLPLFQRPSSRLQVVFASPPCRDCFEVLSTILLLLGSNRQSVLCSILQRRTRLFVMGRNTDWCFLCVCGKAEHSWQIGSWGTITCSVLVYTSPTCIYTGWVVVGLWVDLFSNGKRRRRSKGRRSISFFEKVWLLGVGEGTSGLFGCVVWLLWEQRVFVWCLFGDWRSVVFFGVGEQVDLCFHGYYIWIYILYNIIILVFTYHIHASRYRNICVKMSTCPVDHPLPSSWSDNKNLWTLLSFLLSPVIQRKESRVHKHLLSGKEMGRGWSTGHLVFDKMESQTQSVAQSTHDWVVYRISYMLGSVLSCRLVWESSKEWNGGCASIHVVLGEKHADRDKGCGRISLHHLISKREKNLCRNILLVHEVTGLNRHTFRKS